MARRRNSDLFSTLFQIAGNLLKSIATPTPSRSGQPPSATKRPAPPRPVVLKHTERHIWAPIGDFEFSIVGESNYQPALARLAAQYGREGTFSVDLDHEDDNPHDSLAIVIRHEGRILGYMARADARSYRRRLSSMRLGRSPARCDAQLIGGHQLADGRQASYGLVLDLKPFD